MNPRSLRAQKQIADELAHEAERQHPRHWSRAELQEYLERRGFAVYESEPFETLVAAVEQDMDNLPWEEEG